MNRMSLGGYKRPLCQQSVSRGKKIGCGRGSRSECFTQRLSEGLKSSELGSMSGILGLRV